MRRDHKVTAKYSCENRKKECGGVPDRRGGKERGDSDTQSPVRDVYDEMPGHRPGAGEKDAVCPGLAQKQGGHLFRPTL